MSLALKGKGSIQASAVSHVSTRSPGWATNWRRLSRRGLAIPNIGPITLLCLDLDNFKILNDRMGHAAGDRMLLEFARALDGVLRATDLACRLGGDEFAILLPNAKKEDGAVVAAKIEDLVANNVRFSRHRIGVSIGAVTATEPPPTVDELVTSADLAMYQVKQAHRESSFRHRGDPRSPEAVSKQHTEAPVPNRS